MSLPPLPLDAIDVGLHVPDWRAAIGAAGAALERSGSTAPGYTERMVGVIEEFGAYVVIAPGLALAHARPGPDVLADGLSIVTLATPVNFGHPHNDPVRVVLGLAVTSSSEHLAAVAAVANVFNDSTAITDLAEATSAEQVQAIMAVEP